MVVAVAVAFIFPFDFRPSKHVKDCLLEFIKVFISDKQSVSVDLRSTHISFIERQGSPGSTGSTAHPGALGASHWSESCCAGERRSSDWSTTGPRGDRIGGGFGSEGILSGKRKKNCVLLRKLQP